MIHGNFGAQDLSYHLGWFLGPPFEGTRLSKILILSVYHYSLVELKCAIKPFVLNKCCLFILILGHTLYAKLLVRGEEPCLRASCPC